MGLEFGIIVQSSNLDFSAREDMAIPRLIGDERRFK